MDYFSASTYATFALFPSLLHIDVEINEMFLKKDLDCYPVAHQERYLYFKRIFSFPKLCESHLLFRGIASQVLNWQGEQL